MQYTVVKRGNTQCVWCAYPLFTNLSTKPVQDQKYPDKPKAHGIPYTGLSNARPETKAIGVRIKRQMKNMPFNVKEYPEFHVPGSDSTRDWGQ